MKGIPEYAKEILANADASASVQVSVPPEPEPVPEATEPIVDETEIEAIEAEEEAEAEAPSEPPEEPLKPPRPPRRFEFAFKASSLRTFLAQLAHMADDVKIHATEGQWLVRTVDPAHVAMIEVSLTDLIDCFERVRSTNTLERIQGDVEIGVDVEKLLALVKKVKKDDVVQIDVDLPNDQDKDVLTVTFGGMTRTMPAIDTAGISDPKAPAMTLPARVEVAAGDLLEAAKAAEEITDHVRLTATREGLNVLGEGDADKVSMDFRHGEKADVRLEGTEDRYTSLFPLDYLTSFLKVVKDQKLVLRLGTDVPVRADWEGATKGTYLCAPRIETTE